MENSDTGQHPILERPIVVDPTQLVRIEAVHRGFLFQHLYAAHCLLLAPGTDVKAIIVESDEDVEIVRPTGRTYIQVKSRITPLGFSDIADALDRFSSYRALHATGERPGKAIFVIATNAPPTPSLLEKVKQQDWPKDVRLDYPTGDVPPDPVTPKPSDSLGAAFFTCCKIAGKLPFAMLSPESLVWKLAGMVMLAASGGAPRTDHAFHSDELGSLFEQLAIQLQDFPSPPVVYRSQIDEPPLQTDASVRLITGYSGAGKTAWASQAALHASGTAIYLDTRDIPGPGLASSLAREIAARLFGTGGGGLGKVLLSGASGTEILFNLSRHLRADQKILTLVLDNIHSPPPADVAAVIRSTPDFRFVLLGQPGRNTQELSALLRIQSEALGGWSPDTIAAEAAANGCRVNAAASEALLHLTGGLPLYVQNAISIAAREHGGSVAELCERLSTQTHSVETAQELILATIIEALQEDTRRALAVLSLSNVPLTRNEVFALLRGSLECSDVFTAAQLRQLRTAGIIEIFGSETLKVHDTIRFLGTAHLASLGSETRQLACKSLRDVLASSLQERWEHRKLGLYLRMLAETGQIKTLVQLGTDELFHELGLWSEIKAYLEAAASSNKTDPEARFWALDGIVFNDMRIGADSGTVQHIELMKRLVEEHGLGTEERLAIGMKEMNILAWQGRPEDAFRTMHSVAAELKPDPMLQRIFRYNAAAALLQLGDSEAAASEAMRVATEYYDILGLTPDLVLGRNPPELWPLLEGLENPTDDLKHLADCLDLYAKATNAQGVDSVFARIHAMKFYEMAQALESLVRVGQDLVDEFIQRGDFVGARQIIETNLLPMIQQLKLSAHVIPVRSQYAVTLAYCGDFRAAEAEMARLEPYEAGLTREGQMELQKQRRLIAHLRRTGSLPQWAPPVRSPARSGEPHSVARSSKIGRNEPCPCGSGKKYKKCHG
jgi:hypothetical protein